MSEVSIAAWTSKQKIVTKYSILSKRLWDNMIAVPWLIAQGYTNLVPTLIYHDNQGMLVSNQRNAQQRAKQMLLHYFYKISSKDLAIQYIYSKWNDDRLHYRACSTICCTTSSSNRMIAHPQ